MGVLKLRQTFGLRLMTCWLALALSTPESWLAACILIGDQRGLEARAERDDETLAILTRFSGEVAVERRDGEEVAATPLMALSDGDRVKLSGAARATVVCRDDRALEFDRSQRMTDELCAQGTELPAGSFAIVEPRGGRIQPVAGSYEPASRTRELPEHYEQYPVVLSPRHTALLESRPQLQWTEVPGAVDYRIQWSGPGFPAFATSRKELRCRKQDLLDGLVTICSMDWPPDAPRLQEGGVYALTVGAWLEHEQQPRVAEETTPNRIRILDSQRAGELRLVVDRTRSLSLTPPIDEATRLLVLAGHHLQDQVYAEAIPVYRQAVDLQPSAKVYTTLGDAYRVIQLYRFAAESYKQALRLADGDADRAAAEFGLGHVDYKWRRFREAEGRFQLAQEIYVRLDLEEEADAAKKSAELARRRIRR